MDKREVDEEYMQFQLKTARGYFEILEEHFEEMTSEKRTQIVARLEELAEECIPFDPSALDYKEGHFDRELAKKILKKIGVTNEQVASEIGVHPSTFSKYLKDLEKGRTKGARKEVLIYFAEIGYDPFKTCEFFPKPLERFINTILS